MLGSVRSLRGCDSREQVDSPRKQSGQGIPFPKLVQGTPRRNAIELRSRWAKLLSRFPPGRINGRLRGEGVGVSGREANYDCNSQIPSGCHNGRAIFYIFGRYPVEPDGDSYPVLDLVVCHGDFLNADHEYVHKNKNVKGFGSYGDIMIRDRKMYVAPTPFGLTTGTAHNQTLILPADFRVDSRFRAVGKLVRREAQKLIVGYRFDLRTNALKPELVENPASGTEHKFVAYRLRASATEAVAMRPQREVIAEVAETAEEDE